MVQIYGSVKIMNIFCCKSEQLCGCSSKIFEICTGNLHVMEKNTNTLSYNIRLLRKKSGMSQEELANRLNIKRSNIAAYESKNVEPRLKIILEMARLFNISVKALIESRISDSLDFPSFEKVMTSSKDDNSFDLKDNEDVNVFINKSEKIRKVLEGFKAFYTFKKNAIVVDSPEKEKLTFDIDNFIQLMEHLLSYNESVIKAISTSNKSQAE